MKPSKYHGKTVFLVGGSTGIGLAIAKRFILCGANVILFARNESRLTDAVQQLSGLVKHDKQVVDFEVLDAANHLQVEHVLNATVNKYGCPDGLINCAGRAIPNYIENIHIDQFEETIKINLFSCRNTVHTLFPHMKKKGGFIVNTASIAGLIGVFGYSDYSASKFAIIGYSEALRSELKAHNIHVSVLCPPDTDTPGFHNENKTKPAETHAVSAGASLLSADQVAEIFMNELPRHRPLIIPGKAAKFSIIMKRLFPSLVEWVMDRGIKNTKANRQQ